MGNDDGRRGGVWRGMGLALAAALVLAGPARADEPWDPRKGPNPTIDYDTVDISTLSILDLTFVPERRKEPVLRQMLAAGDWKPKPGWKQAPYCDALLADLRAWKDVEIVEPVIRANWYGDSAFDPWREKCPDFDPHKFVRANAEAIVSYGTHDFKVFDIAKGPNESDLNLLFFHGIFSSEYVDRLGVFRSGFRPNLNTGLGGHYRLIDLKKCSFNNLIGTSTGDFVYYSRYHQDGIFSESALFFFRERYFVISGNFGKGRPKGSMNLHEVLSGTDSSMPGCKFTANFWRG